MVMGVRLGDVCVVKMILLSVIKNNDEDTYTLIIKYIMKFWVQCLLRYHNNGNIHIL